MNLTSSKGLFSMFAVVFFLSVIVVSGIMELRFLKNLLFNYEDNIKQIAINKTTLFFNDIKAVSLNALQQMEAKNGDITRVLKTISTYDHRITNVHLLDPDGSIVYCMVSQNEKRSLGLPISEINNEGHERVVVSGVYVDPYSHLRIISTASKILKKDGSIDKILLIDFKIDQYQKEMMHEFINDNYMIAVFDQKGHPVFWPFGRDKLEEFSKQQNKFFNNREQFNVVKSETSQPAWQLYFFFKENNFETFRTITILFFVFALYCCLYQLLVEIWGINSVKTYFENIDFAILNQVNEGVIITNNSGRIVFANRTAHEIFAQRRSTLINIRLKEILGHVEDIHDEKEKAVMFTLKMPDKFLEAIHSPIIKKGKKLGSLTVIRVDVKEEKNFRIVLNKLVDIIPEGVVYVDKNHEISAANLMARCYLGNLEKGTSIDVVDPRLAEFIYENIGSGAVKRVGLSLYDLSCEISPVYDDDGVYAGTLVVLLTDLDQKNHG